MAFDATYDACVLHPAGLRDLLVRLATTGMFRAHWSADILDEMVRSILRRRPDLTEALKAQALWWEILAGRTSNPDDRVRSAANAAHLRHAVELITATRQESKP